MTTGEEICPYTDEITDPLALWLIRQSQNELYLEATLRDIYDNAMNSTYRLDESPVDTINTIVHKARKERHVDYLLKNRYNGEL